MSSVLHIVRYPSGAKEFRMSDEAPAVGDVLTRDGENWAIEDLSRAPDGTMLAKLRLVPPLEARGPR